MTISYSGSFFRLLLRWKGSIWRSTWKELSVYLVLYYIVRAFYIFVIPVLDDEYDSKRKYFSRKFEALCIMFDNYTKLIPLTFLLGFYVSNVVARWWRQFESLNWPEDLLTQACLIIPGSDERSVKRRHLIARYVNLTAALSWRDISTKLRMKFPNMSSIQAAGLMTEKEAIMLEDINAECPYVRWMTPLHWIQLIVLKEVKDSNPPASLVNNFLKDLGMFRQQFRRLFCYDWVCVPLPYTQVAALATYAFFIFCLFGRQFIDRSKDRDSQIDLQIPIFTIVQFLFFVGWFKIGQDLMRPFGTDDDDIELVYIFERNLSTSFTIVHKLQETAPPMDDAEEDPFWKKIKSEKSHFDLPDNQFSKKMKNHAPKLHSYIRLSGDEEDKAETLEDSKCRPSIKPFKKQLHW